MANFGKISVDVGNHREKARSIIRRQQFTRALEFIGNLLSRYPQDQELNFLMADALFGTGRTSEAYEQTIKSLELAGEHIPAENMAHHIFILMKSAAETGNLENAFFSVEPMLSKYPRSERDEIWIDAAKLMFQEDRLDLAYELSRRVSSRSIFPEIFAARYHMERGDFERGHTNLQAANSSLKELEIGIVNEFHIAVACLFIFLYDSAKKKEFYIKGLEDKAREEAIFLNDAYSQRSPSTLKKEDFAKAIQLAENYGFIGRRKRPPAPLETDY